MAGKPAELVKAEVVEMIAQRYHVLPSQAAREDAAVLKHLAILALANQDAPISSVDARPRLAAMEEDLAVLSLTLGAGDGQ